MARQRHPLPASHIPDRVKNSRLASELHTLRSDGRLPLSPFVAKLIPVTAVGVVHDRNTEVFWTLDIATVPAVLQQDTPNQEQWSGGSAAEEAADAADSSQPLELLHDAPERLL